MNDPMDIAKTGNVVFLSNKEELNMTTLWKQSLEAIILWQIVVAFALAAIVPKPANVLPFLPRQSATGARQGAYGNVVDFRVAGTRRLKRN